MAKGYKKVLRAYTLSLDALDRLDLLFENAKKQYGIHASRSKIIESLILNTQDPIERKREECREANRRFQSIQKELEIMEETKIKEIRKVDQ